MNTIGKLSFLIIAAFITLPLIVQSQTGSEEKPREFKVNINQTKLDHIKARVEAYNWPVSFDDKDWSMGANLNYMKELADYWVNEYNWSVFERTLNKYPQYIVNIDGINIHYYHIKSKNGNGKPILISHGWPGSPAEYFDVIDDLTNPQDQRLEAYNLVIPSLPGYGFSGKPKSIVGPVSTAKLYHQLMTTVLDYDKYYGVAGDLGGLVQTLLAQNYPEDLIAIHFQNIAVGPLKRELFLEEQAWQTTSNQYLQREMTYFPMQMIKPMTVALTLEDNPIGSAAWVVEKIQIWTDNKGDINNSLSKKQIIDMIMYYLVNDNMSSAINFYGGALRETGGALYPKQKIKTPTALINFPKDYINAHPPKSWAEEFYNIQQWSSPDHGGHFPALEAPAELVNDVRKFFKNY